MALIESVFSNVASATPSVPAVTYGPETFASYAQGAALNDFTVFGSAQIRATVDVETGWSDARRVDMSPTLNLSDNGVLAWDVLDGVQYPEVLVRVTSGRSNDRIGIALHANAALTKHYLIWVDAGSGQLMVYRTPNTGAGSDGFICSSCKAVPYSTTTKRLIRAGVYDNGDGTARVRVRVWNDGAAEPASWDVDYLDAAPILIGGGGEIAGVYQYRALAAPWLDAISAGSGGASAPSLPAI